MPKQRASEAIQALRTMSSGVAVDDKTKDRERKAKQRASGREVFIPIPVNIERRLACLQDPELLLTTCFPKVYYEPFTEDRRDMLLSIWRAASYGGDQAIAGPRGEGKTTIAMDGALALMLANLSPFPVVVGKNQDSASDELKFLRERMLESDEFAGLFPEIAVPMRAVGPHAANARLQTVGGVFLRMHLGQKAFAFPTITNEMLPHWPSEIESVARGQVIGAVGIDGKIRGFKFRSKRPTLGIIDDIEDKDSVRNSETIAKYETVIEEDIGGMGASSEPIARVYLCTTLNRICNAFKYTDRTKKRSWNGRRYRKMIKPPSRMDLVEQYIDLLKNRKDDDPDAREAYRFWKSNQHELEKDAVVSNKHSYSKKIHEDGEPMELSAVQAYYNVVARRGAKAAATELDNDPPDESGIETVGLTAHKVASRISGLPQGQYHTDTQHVTVGIDVGKYYSHWVKIGWWGNAIGNVIDYGVMENPGMGSSVDKKAVMSALLPAMHQWRTDITADGRLDFCLIDSGDFTEAVYEFVRQVGGTPFAAAKGWDTGRYRQPLSPTNDKKPFHECYAARQPEERIWLYHVHTEYWKQWLQERFVTDTFSDQQQFNDGTLSLFASGDKKKHTSYSHHIVAEERRDTFEEGKGLIRKWVVVNRNNHYLDATALACAAAGCLGVRIVARESVQNIPKPKKPQPRAPIVNPYGQPFLATERK